MALFKFWYIFVFFAFFKSSTSFDLYQELQDLNFEDLDINLNSSCIQDLSLLFSSIKNQDFEEWALTMIDSSAKVPNGLLGGNLYHIGQFDECLTVVHPDNHFMGKHCMAKIDFSLPLKKKHKMELLMKSINAAHPEREAEQLLSLRYGICLPSTCSAEDMNQIFYPYNFTNVNFYDTHCFTGEKKEFSSGSWALIGVLIALLALAVCSTLYELYQLHIVRNAKPNPMLISFSLYSNTINLFEIRDSSGEMACLHGMRTISMIWVVLGHTFETIENYPVINLLDAVKVRTDPNYIMITNGYYSVDSFFFLSGLLVAFVFFRNISKNGYYDAPINYIHRYIRLTPSLLMIILVHITLLQDLSKGPQWGARITPLSDDCKKTWWSYLLYVQNYAQHESNCIGQAWYLSCDMQMFWIAPIILYPIYLWPKIGMLFLAFLTLGSTALTFALAYASKFKANMTVVIDPNQFFYDYVTAHTRIMPWLVGVALGVAICAIKARKINVRLSKMTVILGWICSTSLCLGLLYSFTSFDDNHSPSDLEAAIYLSFTRLGWAVGLTWVVFACIYGYGGWANRFLSVGIFQPLGKLSYNVYLVHQTVLTYRCAVYRTNFSFDNLDIAYEFLGALVLSHLFAIMFHTLLDAPFAVIDRQLLSKIKILPYPRPQKQPINKIENNIEDGEGKQSYENPQKVID